MKHYFLEVLANDMHSHFEMKIMVKIRLQLAHHCKWSPDLVMSLFLGVYLTRHCKPVTQCKASLTQ